MRGALDFLSLVKAPSNRTVMHPLIYPRHTKVATLEYDWDGYSTVMMFSTDDDVETVQAWYRKLDLKLDAVDSDQYHFFSDAARRKKVAAVSFAYEESFEDLSSYLGSEELDSMIAAKPETIGVLCKKIWIFLPLSF